MNTTELQQAEQFIHAHEHQKAKALLAKILLVDQDNEDAWLLLVRAVQTDDEKIHCLREALRINPRNRDAIRQLGSLQARIRMERLPSQKTSVEMERSIPAVPILQVDQTAKKQNFIFSTIWGGILGLWPFLKYILRRFLYMIFTLVLLTIFLYGAFVFLLPPEARAAAFVPPWTGRGNLQNRLEATIEEYGFRDPFPVQYFRWASKLLQGDWGISTAINDEVLDVLLIRTPATAELLFFSLVMFIPLGLISGVIAGARQGRWFDSGFRVVAFISTSIPPFVLGLMLLAVFYIGLHWFPPGRVSPTLKIVVNSPEFKNYTSLIMVDGILNGRLDITIDAIRHLVLPAFTLSLTYWATLGRVTRAVMLDELKEDYIITAHGKGLRKEQVVWRHVFRNVLIPGLNSIALSAAMFLTTAVIIEIIFGYPGISSPLTRSFTRGSADVNLAMGFAVYSTLFVLPLMFILDILQGLVDPRIREGGR